MNVELLTIGTELLLGFTLDTNAAEISRALASVGARVVRHTTIGDIDGGIRGPVEDALRRTRFVITTGGLGPTRDDMTKKAVAEIFDAPLELDESYLDALRARFASLGRGPMPVSNRSQAEVPRGATVLPNHWGTAPGLWIEGVPGTAVLLPGVPREMRKLLEHEVLPRLATRAGGEGGVIRSLTVRTTGIAESALAERISSIEDRIAPLTLAYLPSVLGVDLRITAWNIAEDRAGELLRAAADAMQTAIGTHWYGEDEADLASVLIQALRRKGMRLAVAESCTGGMLGERLTAVPGASTVFTGGVIAYADEVKVRELGVPEPMLEEHGAVSEPVVREMARGAARTFGVEAAIAITGIAGPGGSTEEKPVGTVWLGGTVGGAVQSQRRRFLGSRYEVRARSAQAGIDLLRAMLR